MRPRVSWPTIPKVVQHADARSLVMTVYNASGYGPDDFASKRSARQVMVDALCRAEDFLEHLGSATKTERASIRLVRRQLEAEVYA